MNQNLGVNPAETLSRSTGDWALYFVLITLSVTPIRRMFKWPGVIRLSRMLGLYAFFYACLHFLAFIWFDHFFDVNEIIKDIIKRPFITIGFICFLILIPLAITSSNKMMRRLGKNWQRLHRLIYAVSILALTHYFLMIKADYQTPLIILCVLILLLGYRIKFEWLKKSKD